MSKNIVSVSSTWILRNAGGSASRKITIEEQVRLNFENAKYQLDASETAYRLAQKNAQAAQHELNVIEALQAIQNSQRDVLLREAQQTLREILEGLSSSRENNEKLEQGMLALAERIEQRAEGTNLRFDS